MRKIAILLLWGAASFGCWILFVATPSAHELSLAVAFTALTVFLGTLAWRHMPVGFSPTFTQSIALWRLPWYVLSGSWEMLVILIKDLVGRHPGSFFRATPFQTTEGPEGDAQAVLAIAYTTVAPNFIVVGISQGLLMFHQVEKSEVPRMIRDIEAGR